ncbi:MAG: hypothetical protein A2010_13855 [Nitrospirae bacterium GWD2_57_9]|nr:MAG: hypothetical protein A2010_13855 [Nitrospirae bacterium GWD2_57_9]OGW46455.1 MAG: hypothetical protein A2078_02800 [Nitrospirae bacterium GWC2_57_9]
MKTIIFTDLDGTLLHPLTYSYEPALPALQLIRRKNIPLVLCSSKTRAELKLYQDRLDIGHPFISENGGGIFSPRGYFSSPMEGEAQDDGVKFSLGLAYSRIRKEFTELRTLLGAAVVGFGDMDARQVAALTGLPVEEAVLARMRDFSEPFVFDGDADPRIFRAFEERGLNWTQGRFYCVMGRHDKGKAVQMLIRSYRKEHGKIITIGLGDALNDLPLLQQVDHPVLVQKQDGSYQEHRELAGVRKAPGIGPQGWNSAVLELVSP